MNEKLSDIVRAVHAVRINQNTNRWN